MPKIAAFCLRFVIFSCVGARPLRSPCGRPAGRRKAVPNNLVAGRRKAVPLQIGYYASSTSAGTAADPIDRAAQSARRAVGQARRSQAAGDKCRHVDAWTRRQMPKIAAFCLRFVCIGRQYGGPSGGRIAAPSPGSPHQFTDHGLLPDRISGNSVKVAVRTASHGPNDSGLAIVATSVKVGEIAATNCKLSLAWNFCNGGIS